MRRSKSLMAVAAIGLSLGLAGCSGAGEGFHSEQTEPITHYTFEQELPNGEKTLCVWASDGGSSSGLSCDWESASEEKR